VGYTHIFAIALIARLLLTFLPVRTITAAQQRLWSWEFFVVFSACFALGVVLANRGGLPSPGRQPSRGIGTWMPIGIGSIVAVITMGADMVQPAAAARGLPALHVRGVAAIPFYVYGAVLLTVVFHFLPVAAGVWIARRLHGVARSAILALTLSLVAFTEDLMFFVRFASPGAVETGRHLLSVLANASEAVLIYRFGLLAGLLQRGTTYVLWHIAWPRVSEG
jgi:hypothetical protein